MTTAADLLALAQRVEREEPSRELDAAVLRAFGHQALQRGHVIGWEYRPNGVGIWRSMPSPTTSLDAAASLVPPKWFAVDLYYTLSGQVCFVLINRMGDMLKVKVEAVANSEPQARTAAALRAMAQEARDE